MLRREDTINTFQFHEMIPDEKTATKWFESIRWPHGRRCPHCNSENTVECKKPQPYRCRECRKHFSSKTGTVMQSSNLPIRKWLYAMYLISVSKKGLSSMQLARELGIAQEAAWRLGHKIRESWNQDALFPMGGEVEVDEAYFGGKDKSRRKPGHGPKNKQAVLGMRSRNGHIRAFPVKNTEAQTLKACIRENIQPGSTIYTDCHKSYQGMREYRHEVVAHSAGEYVRDKAHTNGMESF